MDDVVVDEHKAKFNRTHETIKLNLFDLAVLTYRFKVSTQTFFIGSLNDFLLQGQDPKLVGNDQETAWKQVCQKIRNQVPYSYTFPAQFIRLGQCS